MATAAEPQEPFKVAVRNMEGSEVAEFRVDQGACTSIIMSRVAELCHIPCLMQVILFRGSQLQEDAVLQDILAPPPEVNVLDLIISFHGVRAAVRSGENFVASRALQEFGRRGGAEAHAVLREILRDDDWGVRLRAVRVFREIADPGCLPAISTLLEALQRDAHVTVRIGAAEALSRIGLLGDPQAGAGLRAAALGDEDNRVRGAAAAALWSLSAAGSADAAVLETAMQGGGGDGDAEGAFRAEAVRALGAIRERGCTRALEVLRAAFGDSNAEVRGAVLRAATKLATSGDREALMWLAPGVRDSCLQVRLTTVETLHLLASPGDAEELIPLLCEALQDSAIFVCTGALRALNSLAKPGDEVVLAALRRLVDHPEGCVRFSAADTLRILSRENQGSCA